MGTELEGVLDYDNLGPSSDGAIIAPSSGTRCLPPILEGCVASIASAAPERWDVHTVRRYGSLPHYTL